MGREGAALLMRVSALIGKTVRTTAGDSLGAVFDIRVRLREGEPEVVGIVVGKPSLTRQLFEHPRRPDLSTHDEEVVAWEAVRAIDGKTVYVTQERQQRAGSEQ
jgi:sporulation protein YlmC with PRC-barrel domain